MLPIHFLRHCHMVPTTSRTPPFSHTEPSPHSGGRKVLRNRLPDPLRSSSRRLVVSLLRPSLSSAFSSLPTAPRDLASPLRIKTLATARGGPAAAARSVVFRRGEGAAAAAGRRGRRRPMGGAVSGGAAAVDAEGASYPVMLNVYDLTPLNNYLHWCGLGIFHSAVEVHGSEYSFGAHDHPSSGVFEVEPKNCPGFIYRCSIFIGRTSLNPLEFREFIQRMASEYHGDTYHLISKNCNHFTDDLCIRLTGKSIPGWVNRLARLGAFCNCLLPESMRLESTETKHLADCRFSDGSNTTSNENFDEDDLEGKHLLPTSSVSEDAIVKEVHR